MAKVKPSEPQQVDSQVDDRLAEAALHIFTQRTMQQPSIKAEHHAVKSIEAAEVFLKALDEYGSST